MPSTIAARDALHDLAGVGRTKDRLNRLYAALRTQFSFNRVRDIFYADPRISLRDWEHEAIAAALKKKRHAETQGAIDARAEYRELLDRIARLEAAISLSGAVENRAAGDENGGVRGGDHRAVD
jgi:hypothetical protein